MEEKKKINAKIIILFLVLVMIAIGVIINVNATDPSIEFYATSYGVADDYLPSKYKITNQEEVELFYKLQGINFDSKLIYIPQELDFDGKYDLSKNTIFVQIQPCGSGMIKLDFKGVKVDENVKFKYSLKTPFGLLTQDMAYWYLIAIVPNEKLNGVNTDDWESPIEIKNRMNLSEIYEIRVECDDLNYTQSFEVLENTIKSVGNIELESYYENIGYRGFSGLERKYSLLTYDEYSARKITEEINNMNIGMLAKISTNGLREVVSKPTNYYVRLSYGDPTITMGSNGYDSEDKIIELLKPDKIDFKGRGSLSFTMYDDFSVANVEKMINNIQEHVNEWKVGYHELKVYFEVMNLEGVQ